MYTLTVCRLDTNAPRVWVHRGGKVEIGPMGPKGEPEGASLALYGLEVAEALGQALLTAVQAERDYLARHEAVGMGTARQAL